MISAVNPTEKTVDVSYKVSKGPEVYIDKVEITGNTKTRDKVIRRELQLEEQQRFAGSTVERDRGVVLGVDLGGGLDQELSDGVAADVHAQDAARCLLGIVGGADDHHPAGLAPPAGCHLRLEGDPAAEVGRRLTGPVGRRHHAALRYRDPPPGEQLLALVFEEVQRSPPGSYCGDGRSSVRCSHPMISVVFVPGVKISAMPAAFRGATSSAGMMPPPKTGMSPAPFSARSRTTATSRSSLRCARVA